MRHDGDLRSDRRRACLRGLALARSGWFALLLSSLAFIFSFSIAHAGKIVVLDEKDKPAVTIDSDSIRHHVRISIDEARERARDQRELARDAEERARDAQERGRDATEWLEDSLAVERDSEWRERVRTGRRTDEMVSFGQDVVVDRDQVVGGDVVSMGGSAKIDGVVLGSVVALGGEVHLSESAIVEGDAVSIGGGGVEAQPGSVVTGQAVAIGGRILDEAGSRIGDRVELTFIPSFGRKGLMGFRGWMVTLILCMHVIFIGLIGYLLTRLAARRWAAGMATLKARPWESLLAGIGVGILFSIIGIPLLAVIMVALIAIVVGIPLVPLVAFVLLILPVPGYLITCLVLGRAVRPSLDGQASSAKDLGWAFLLGHLLLSIPWLLLILLSGITPMFGILLLTGWAVIGLAVAFGWGAFLLSRFGSRLPVSGAAPIPAGIGGASGPGTGSAPGAGMASGTGSAPGTPGTAGASGQDISPVS